MSQEWKIAKVSIMIKTTQKHTTATEMDTDNIQCRDEMSYSIHIEEAFKKKGT